MDFLARLEHLSLGHLLAPKNRMFLKPYLRGVKGPTRGIARQPNRATTAVSQL